MSLSSTDFKIREGSLADVSGIVSLVESVYRGSSSQKGWTTEADLLDGQRTDADMIQSLMQNPRNHFFIVERDHMSLAASVFLEKRDGHGYMGMLAVATDLQNHKLGRKLVTHCEEQVRRWGLSHLKITVLEQRTELIAWYERLGFQRTGLYEKFPEDPRYGLPKVNDLRLVEFLKKL